MIYFCYIFIWIIHSVANSIYTNNKYNNSKAPVVFTHSSHCCDFSLMQNVVGVVHFAVIPKKI